MTATNEDSFRMVKELALKEGLLVGPSSGSVMSSILKIAQKIKEGILVGIFADDGRKFKSLYDQQKVFTNEEYETLLQKARNLSTPAYALN
jgi:cysteine synthase B